MKITGDEVGNTGVCVEITVLGIDNPGVQDTFHEDNNNECEDGDMREIAYEDIPEEDVHHPQITSPNERRIYNLRLIKPRKHPVVVGYAHAQIVHYAMTQYSLSKGLKKFKKVGYMEVEK